VLENESEKYHVYYAYEEIAKGAIKRVEHMLGRGLYVYDIFPNLTDETKTLSEPLSVITESQKEMFLPVGIKVRFIGIGTVLFGYESEESS
tara:strand:- start:523 stop:795 length:273 start_codon:yes stop_codon:yes gene_type:complete